MLSVSSGVSQFCFGILELCFVSTSLRFTQSYQVLLEIPAYFNSFVIFIPVKSDIPFISFIILVLNSSPDFIFLMSYQNTFFLSPYFPKPAEQLQNFYGLFPLSVLQVLFPVSYLLYLLLIP